MTIRMKSKKKRVLNIDSTVIKRRRGGGTLIESRPVFSSDSKYVFLNCGWCLKVFSVVTGECIRVHEIETESRIKAVLYHDDQVGACTSDGNVTFWSKGSSKISHNYNIKLMRGYSIANALMVRSLEDTSKDDDLCILFQKDQNTSVRFFCLKTGLRKNHPLDKKELTDIISPNCISFGGSEELPIIASVSTEGLNIYPVNGHKPTEHIKAGNDRKWTCVRCHPCNDTIAAGDNTGRVVLFRSTNAKKGPKPVYHWHTLPCNDIAFTPAGSSMFTGGKEHVLVKWNIENPAMRNYLPRLSSHVVYITVSPDNQLVALSTLDNAVQIVTSTNKLQCVLQQLSWSVLPSNWLKPFPSGLVYEPRTRSICLNGRTGHLQFYSPHTESLVQIIDVTLQNYLTQERNKIIVNTEVTKCALSDDGIWLATIETRADEGMATEIRMKFWQYILSKRCFSLNTSIELPHENSVNDLSFKPGSGLLVQNDSDQILDTMIVTTGGDKKARIWSPSPLDSVYRKGVLWECQNTCYYRDMDCGPCSFSYDGSLLAIAFGPSCTLWDVDNITLKESLSRGTKHLTFVEFGKRDCCHLLVTVIKKEISVWNLLTLSLFWNINMNTNFLVPDPFSNYMAIFTEENSLHIFHLVGKDPVFTKTDVCGSGCKAISGVFLPRDKTMGGTSWMSFSQLYYIDTNQELYAFETEMDSITNQHFSLDTKDERLTPFATMIANQQKNAVVQYQKVAHASGGRSFASDAAISQLLKSGAHTLPSVSLICGSLLRSLVTYKETVQKDKKKEDRPQEMEVDQSSSSEEEHKSPKSPKRTPNKKSPKTPVTPVDMNALFPEAFMDDEDEPEEEEILLNEKFVIDEGAMES